FDPHVLTSDANLLNAPRPVYAKLKAKDKELSLRDQAVTVYGESKFPDPAKGQPPAQEVEAGKALGAWVAGARHDHTRGVTGWGNTKFATRPLTQLTGAVAQRISGDGQDQIWVAPAYAAQHLALESEKEMLPGDALTHHAGLLRAAHPDAPDWVIGGDSALA